MALIGNSNWLGWDRDEASLLVAFLGFRLFIADRSKRRALYAERNEFVKVLRVGKWAVRLRAPWSKP